jgi:hypothetical protein
MKVLKDDDWSGFSRAMGEALPDDPVPQSFFEHFYWENIATKAYNFINNDNK